MNFIIHNNNRFIVAVILLLGSLLSGWSAFRNSPTELEVAQLPAGLSHLTLGKFDLCLVNPPLIRTVASLPVWLASAKTDWKHYSNHPPSRAERLIGINFLEANGTRSFWLFTLSRLACLPFVLMGGLVCSIWAKEFSVMVLL